jgi:hypothetical protein
MTVKLTPVKSGSIAAIGHDAERNVLAVQFKGGGLYHYPNVTAQAHAALIGAKSIGSHFGQHFRGAKFTKPK